MTDFFTQLIEKSGFDKALVRRALDFTKELNLNELSRLLFDKESFSVEKTGVLYFQDAFYPFDFFTKTLSICEKEEISPEKLFLYVYISLLEKSYFDFLSRMKDSKIFFDSMRRFVEASAEHFSNTSDDGIYDYHFLANHIRGNILRLSGLEYQFGHFDGKKSILLHLPDNADLSKENRLYSYRLARQYFGNHPIIADSWILFPEHKKMLSGDSRILDFFDDFDIISTHETHDYSELFHVFGRLSDFSYDNLPKETALQRAYAERIKKTLPVGSAIGKLKY